MNGFDVVTIGSATKDIFLFNKQANLKQGLNSHFLEVPLDRKVEINKVSEFTGGSATNAAKNIYKLGLEQLEKLGTLGLRGTDTNACEDEASTLERSNASIVAEAGSTYSPV